MENRLSDEERNVLLQLARRSLKAAAAGQPGPVVKLDELSPALREPGAAFVTLTIHGDLRGCVGALEPYQPLAEDVCEHAMAAAVEDYRFPPVQLEEVDRIKIEISRLTLPQNLEYSHPPDLLRLLRPHIDGVTLMDGMHRATFLPQVWEKLPDPEVFLAHLCDKMGVRPDAWRTRKMRVQIYQVEEFSEQAG